jgi:hypothetical protein
VVDAVRLRAPLMAERDSLFQGVAQIIRLEDHSTHPGGWDDLPRDVEFTPWQERMNPGIQSGTYFKSIRTTEDGREIWTWGGVDPETLAAGWVAGGGRRAV